MNRSEFQPCFSCVKSTTGLKWFSTFFLENERIFQIKNYIKFVHLLRSTTMQKKSHFGRFLHGFALNSHDIPKGRKQLSDVMRKYVQDKRC